MSTVVRNRRYLLLNENVPPPPPLSKLVLNWYFIPYFRSHRMKVPEYLFQCSPRVLPPFLQMQSIKTANTNRDFTNSHQVLFSAKCLISVFSRIIYYVIGFLEFQFRPMFPLGEVQKLRVFSQSQRRGVKVKEYVFFFHLSIVTRILFTEVNVSTEA